MLPVGRASTTQPTRVLLLLAASVDGGAALYEALRAGSSVVYPTSSLPGLGCLPQAAALDRLERVLDDSLSQIPS